MLRTYFHEQFYDMPVDVAQKYADAIREAILSGRPFDADKKEGYFLSRSRGFDDKLYVGNIHRIESHLYWNDEELADDDQIVNVVVIDGPVTRDGDGCSYGSKDIRDQILYANTIPQVVGHVFIINTPGGAASARIDFEQAIADCREKGKPTVAWVDGLCCSAGQLVAALCDRTVVMNGRHTMGCIGTMCAFWGVPNGTVDRDGYRYIELVSVSSPDKNAEYREAVDGKTEKLQKELDLLGEEFRETVRQNRPLVKEEHLTGRTFDAQDVMGALVDEIGDYVRAIECVFELADKKMQPAREAVPEGEPQGGGEEEPERQEAMASLSAQQTGAIAASPGATMIVENGHLKTTVDTMFGPVEMEIATPKKESDMTEEEKKAAEAEAAQAAEENTAAEQAPEEAPAAEEAPAQEEEPVQEEQAPAAEEPAAEPAPEGEGEEAPAAEEAPVSEEEAPAEGQPAGEETPAAGEPEAPADAQEENARITEALHSAEALVEQKDKEIALLTADKETLSGLVAKHEETIGELRGFVADRDKAIAEKQDAIEKLQKQVADLKAEVKELAEKPAPMTTAAAGVPAGNGTGEAPQANRQRIRPGMSYEEIRGALK